MDKIKVTGGNRLKGIVEISGAKNAALPLMTAALLSDKPLKLSNMPHLVDIATMANLLVQHGVDFKLDGAESSGSSSGNVIILTAKEITNFEAPYNIVRKMRASVLVLGPLLARFGHAKVSLPGGCAIGTRPIDLHLKALEQMGAIIDLQEGYISAKVNGRLKGAHILFDKVSVGATENLLMAATLADGVTTLANAAKEPEITDLAHCLVAMGAKIDGIGTDTLVITGVKELHGAEYSVIPDRIEAGTYMIAAAITDGDVEIRGINADIMYATIEKLDEAGVEITPTDNGLRIRRKGKDIHSVNVTTQAYPGFATDMQAQFMALMCIGDGASVINETIFENRYMHVSELTRMGADIKVDGHTAVVKGHPLKGAEIMATDLRASVSLVLAALVAEGETRISRMYHIDRGYERIEEKLAALGAKIERYNG
jgi:UDP-N-acetylglucosamine 1-carboxyvinyltransferase